MGRSEEERLKLLEELAEPLHTGIIFAVGTILIMLDEGRL